MDNFTSLIPLTMAFSVLANTCLVHQRNLDKSCSSGLDICRKGGLICGKKTTTVRKGWASEWLYAITLTLYLGSALRPQLGIATLLRWVCTDGWQSIGPSFRRVSQLHHCVLKEGDAKLCGATWRKHMQWYLVFLCKKQTSGFIYLLSAMAGWEPSSLGNRGQACC